MLTRATPSQQYCFYWIACIFTLVYMKWSEGRTTLFGLKSAAYRRREARRARAEASESESESEKTAPGSETPSIEEAGKKEEGGELEAEVATPGAEVRQFMPQI